VTGPIGSPATAATRAAVGPQPSGPGTLPTAGSQGPRPAPPEDAKLRSVVRQLEGVFTEQLFKAMRETVPKDDGVVSGGSGEEIFTGLLDQHLAADTPTQWQHGLGEALYRQLRGRLAEPAAEAPGTTPLDRMPTRASGDLNTTVNTTAGDAGR
jgi:flagellar protein FlgJ